MMSRSVRRFGLAVLAIGLAIGALFAIPLDGVAHGGELRLLGRLHPLIVHFPLGLLLLVPVLEWFGRRRPGLQEAAGFVLGFALIGAVMAVVAGLALARADGHEGALLTNHLWGGVAVVIATAVTWAIRGHQRFAYGLALLATLGTLGWAAHQGGSLTHGEDYLVEPLPVLVKHLLRLKETPAPETYTAGSVFAVGLQPIFEKHCISCHGAEKQKGEYRMDSFAALLAGGKSGKPAISPGQLSQSELVRRILLDAVDEKAMPPKKKPRLTAGELAMVRWWVKQGASRELMVADVRDAPAEVAAQLLGPASETGEPAYVPRVGDYTSHAAEIAGLEKELGIKLIPVSRHAGDGLILRVRGAEDRFGDAELAKLAPLAAFVVEAELGGTQITDAGLTSFRPFKQLERLHLERTKLTGTSLEELKALSRLSYLNLCATQVSDDKLAALHAIPSLRQLYLFGSKATEAGVRALRSALPECEMGTVVVRKEIEPPPAPGAAPPS